MLDMYVTGTFAIDATDPRNQFNARALHEARIATDTASTRSNDRARAV